MGQRLLRRKKLNLGGNKMHHEQVMIVAFAVVVLALVLGFTAMIT